MNGLKALCGRGDVRAAVFAGYRHLNFQMFYDNNGQHIPVSAIGISKIRVEKVELYHDGKVWDVPVKLAD